MSKKKSKAVPPAFPSLLDPQNRSKVFTVAFWAVFANFLYFLWNTYWVYVPVGDLDKILPSREAVLYNLGLLKHWKGGYADVLQSWFVLLSMSGWFYFTGRLLLRRILRSADPAEAPLSASISFPELVAVRWFLGSWACGMVWFFLGVLGLYKSWIGVALLPPGAAFFVYFAARFVRSFDRSRFASFRPTLPAVGAAVVAVWTFSWSATMVLFPSYWDTLMTDMALPSYYVGEGRLTPTPFHIYSYFHQNNQLLMVWVLLCHAKPAAYLLVWAFFMVLLVFLYGWLSRIGSKGAAVLSIAVFVFSFLGPWLGLYIKNDLQLGIFIILGWWATLLAFDAWWARKPGTGRWMFLSGIFGGIACGYKFTATPSLAITAAVSFLFFALHAEGDLKQRARTSLKLELLSAAGILLSWGPWLIRNLVIARNPFYPFLNGLFHAKALFPWHETWQHLYNQYNLMYLGWKGVGLYVGNLTQSWLTGSMGYAAIWWGASAWLCFSAFLALSKRFTPPIRWISTIGLASWLFSLLFALKPPYYAGPIIFCFTCCFCFVLNAVFRSGTFARAAVVTALVLDCARSWSAMGTKSLVAFSTLILASGSPYWHYTKNIAGGVNFATVDEMNWVYSLINRHTPPDDRVLIVGYGRPYGLDRKFYACFTWDMQPMLYFAEQAKDAEDLRDKLLAHGVRQVVYDPAAWKMFLENKTVDGPPFEHDIPIAPADLDKINRFVSRYLVPRFQTPSGRLAWYSVRSSPGETFPPIAFDSEDIYRHPLLFMDLAQSLLDHRKLDEALPILKSLRKLSFNPYIGSQIDNWFLSHPELDK